MTFELTPEQHELLIFALGIAAGASSLGSTPLAEKILRLANAVNKDNPRWHPYEVPAD